MTPVVEPSGLVGLLARVEAATGADRGLDAATWKAVFPNGTWVVENGYQLKEPVPLVTASLDAALALCERTRAAHGIDAAQMLHEAVEDLANGGWRDDKPIVPQIALAVIARILRSIIAKEAPDV